MKHNAVPPVRGREVLFTYERVIRLRESILIDETMRTIWPFQVFPSRGHGLGEGNRSV